MYKVFPLRELNQADWETKLDIIRKLVQRIEIDDDNVHVVFRLKELALERQKNVHILSAR